MGLKSLLKAGNAIKKVRKQPTFSQVSAAFSKRKMLKSAALAKHKVKKARKRQRTFNRKANKLLGSLTLSR